MLKFVSRMKSFFMPSSTAASNASREAEQEESLPAPASRFLNETLSRLADSKKQPDALIIHDAMEKLADHLDGHDDDMQQALFRQALRRIDPEAARRIHIRLHQLPADAVTTAKGSWVRDNLSEATKPVARSKTLSAPASRRLDKTLSRLADPAPENRPTVPRQIGKLARHLEGQADSAETQQALFRQALRRLSPAEAAQVRSLMHEVPVETAFTEYRAWVHGNLKEATQQLALDQSVEPFVHASQRLLNALFSGAAALRQSKPGTPSRAEKALGAELRKQIDALHDLPFDPLHGADLRKELALQYISTFCEQLPLAALDDAVRWLTQSPTAQALRKELNDAAQGRRASYSGNPVYAPTAADVVGVMEAVAHRRAILTSAGKIVAKTPDQERTARAEAEIAQMLADAQAAERHAAANQATGAAADADLDRAAETASATDPEAPAAPDAKDAADAADAARTEELLLALAQSWAAPAASGAQARTEPAEAEDPDPVAALVKTWWKMPHINLLMEHISGDPERRKAFEGLFERHHVELAPGIKTILSHSRHYQKKCQQEEKSHAVLFRQRTHAWAKSFERFKPLAPLSDDVKAFNTRALDKIFAQSHACEVLRACTNTEVFAVLASVAEAVTVLPQALFEEAARRFALAAGVPPAATDREPQAAEAERRALEAARAEGTDLPYGHSTAELLDRLAERKPSLASAMANGLVAQELSTLPPVLLTPARATLFTRLSEVSALPPEERASALRHLVATTRSLDDYAQALGIEAGQARARLLGVPDEHYSQQVTQAWDMCGQALEALREHTGSLDRTALLDLEAAITDWKSGLPQRPMASPATSDENVAGRGALEPIMPLTPLPTVAQAMVTLVANLEDEMADPSVGPQPEQAAPIEERRRLTPARILLGLVGRGENVTLDGTTNKQPRVGPPATQGSPIEERRRLMPSRIMRGLADLAENVTLNGTGSIESVYEALSQEDADSLTIALREGPLNALRYELSANRHASKLLPATQAKQVESLRLVLESLSELVIPDEAPPATPLDARFRAALMEEFGLVLCTDPAPPQLLRHMQITLGQVIRGASNGARSGSADLARTTNTVPRGATLEAGTGIPGEVAPAQQEPPWIIDWKVPSTPLQADYQASPALINAIKSRSGKTPSATATGHLTAAIVDYAAVTIDQHWRLFHVQGSRRKGALLASPPVNVETTSAPVDEAAGEPAEAAGKANSRSGEAAEKAEQVLLSVQPRNGGLVIHSTRVASASAFFAGDEQPDPVPGPEVGGGPAMPRRTAQTAPTSAFAAAADWDDSAPGPVTLDPRRSKVVVTTTVYVDESGKSVLESVHSGHHLQAQNRYSGIEPIHLQRQKRIDDEVELRSEAGRRRASERRIMEQLGAHSITTVREEIEIALKQPDAAVRAAHVFTKVLPEIQTITAAMKVVVPGTLFIDDHLHERFEKLLASMPDTAPRANPEEAEAVFDFLALPRTVGETVKQLARQLSDAEDARANPQAWVETLADLAELVAVEGVDQIRVAWAGLSAKARDAIREQFVSGQLAGARYGMALCHEAGSYAFNDSGAHLTGLHSALDELLKLSHGRGVERDTLDPNYRADPAFLGAFIEQFNFLFPYKQPSESLAETIASYVEQESEAAEPASFAKLATQLQIELPSHISPDAASPITFKCARDITRTNIVVDDRHFLNGREVSPDARAVTSSHSLSFKDVSTMMQAMEIAFGAPILQLSRGLHQKLSGHPYAVLASQSQLEPGATLAGESMQVDRFSHANTPVITVRPNEGGATLHGTALINIVYGAYDAQEDKEMDPSRSKVIVLATMAAPREGELRMQRVHYGVHLRPLPRAPGAQAPLPATRRARRTWLRRAALQARRAPSGGVDGAPAAAQATPAHDVLA